MEDNETPSDALEFYDEEALLDRLTTGLSDEDRQVVFVVGSALTAPAEAGAVGVPGVQGVIELIGDLFDGNLREQFTEAIKGSKQPYQEAFRFLIGRRGQKAANGVIKTAVACAREPAPNNSESERYNITASTRDDVCREFDNDSTRWLLTPGVDGLGRLIASNTNQFGRMLVTTNFDPLIGAAIARHGGHSFRTFLHRDGGLGQADGQGTHLVHLHGYWYGADTLHTPRQLMQNRPQLRASLAQLIRGSICVVIAYGGWDDAFTQALMDVVIEDGSFPEVIWCFYSEKPDISSSLLSALSPGIDRGRVNLYAGVDAHRFFPRLADAWNAPIESQASPLIEEIKVDLEVTESQPTYISDERPIDQDLSTIVSLVQDRPPVVEFLVGREDEREALTQAEFKIGFVTGFGGQGKSVLTAKYFGSADAASRYQFQIWRDCREQSAKFEDQIVTLISAMSRAQVSAAELSKMSIEDLADRFHDLTRNRALLIVFDNMDHYVDLETNRIVGTPGRFIDRFVQHGSKTKIIMTCRPPVKYDGEGFFSLHLTGIAPEAAKELFSLRKAFVEPSIVDRLHVITGGHAFWLDLIAAQVANRPADVNIDEMLEAVQTGNGEIPDATLRSIWQSLRVREQVALQALAETLRATQLVELADYLHGQTNYKNLSKSINLLKGLNLVVVKQEVNGEAYELHPLIRAFIQNTFPRTVRTPFILAIFKSYVAFFGLHRKQLRSKPTTEAVHKWLEGAELCINAGRFDEALTCLYDVMIPVRMQEPPSEFVRIAKRLFNKGLLPSLINLAWFEEVFESFIVLLVHIGDNEQASDLLDEYRATIDGKSARYIQYCNLKCYLFWSNGNFDIAIRWGQEGEDLKVSGVDTSFSTKHNLALAQRDSGAVDKALDYFLLGAPLETAIDSAVMDVDLGGAYYGNIGRCLHIMGQIDGALACYKKSAILIERRVIESHVENQAYIRQWIGELLKSQGEYDLGLVFLEASLSKWQIVSPPKYDRLRRAIYTDYPDWPGPPDDASAERRVQAWIKA